MQSVESYETLKGAALGDALKQNCRSQ